MPITFHINAAEGVIYTTAQGVVTDADILAHKDAMVRHPDFRPGMRQLSDARLIERLDVSTAGGSPFAAPDGLPASARGAQRARGRVGGSRGPPAPRCWVRYARGSPPAPRSR